MSVGLLENKLSKTFIDKNLSLTQRIRRISNVACYEAVIHTCFDNKNLLKRVKHAHVLKPETCCVIRSMNAFNPLFTGFFIEQLILRSICNAKNNFLTEAVISSSLRYADRKDYHDKTHIKQFIDTLDAEFYDDVDSVAKSLLMASYLDTYNSPFYPKDYVPCILTNHRLKGAYNFSIASECDLLINDTLYDIKCTKSTHENARIYELLQLLGYSALFRANPKHKKIINTLVVVNLLQGEIRTYDVSDLSDANYQEYLKVLNAYYSITDVVDAPKINVANSHDINSKSNVVDARVDNVKRKTKFITYVKNIVLCCVFVCKKLIKCACCVGKKLKPYAYAAIRRK